MVFIAGNLVFAGLSAAAFYLTGRAVSRVTGLRTEGIAERFAIYPALGMSAYALGLTVLGFAGLYRREVAYAALALGLATAFVKPKTLLEEVRETINRFLSTAASFNYPIRPVLMWAVLLLSFVLLVVALLPQLWLDVLIYRLTLPLKYINAGGLYYVPDIRASSFPQYHEQLNLFGMLLFSTRLSAFFIILTWNVTLVAVYAGARRIYGKEAGFYAGTVFLTVPFVLAILPYGVNDHLWAMYFAVSMYLLLRWSDGGPWRDLVFSWFFAGFALGVKILQLFLLPVHLFVLVVSVLRRPVHITRCLVIFNYVGDVVFRRSFALVHPELRLYRRRARVHRRRLRAGVLLAGRGKTGRFTGTCRVVRGFTYFSRSRFGLLGVHKNAAFNNGWQDHVGQYERYRFTYIPGSRTFLFR